VDGADDQRENQAQPKEVRDESQADEQDEQDDSNDKQHADLSMEFG
jgi:hypothetical protein